MTKNLGVLRAEIELTTWERSSYMFPSCLYSPETIYFTIFAFAQSALTNVHCLQFCALRSVQRSQSVHRATLCFPCVLCSRSAFTKHSPIHTLLSVCAWQPFSVHSSWTNVIVILIKKYSNVCKSVLAVYLIIHNKKQEIYMMKFIFFFLISWKVWCLQLSFKIGSKDEIYNSCIVDKHGMYIQTIIVHQIWPRTKEE